MHLRGALLAAALALACAFGATEAARAQTTAPSASPSPSPSATPSGPSDPCGSLISIINRPEFTTSICTVQTGHVALENGYNNLVITGPGGGNISSYPHSLLRFGTANPHFDVEIGPAFTNHSTAGGTVTNGWSDLGIGVKDENGYSARWLWGENAVLTIPTGSRAFTGGNTQFNGNFNWAYTVNPVLSFAGTMGFNANSAYNSGGVPQSYFAFTPSVEAVAALPGPSQIVAEYAYFSAAGPNLGSQSYYDFTYSRDLGAHVQVDAQYGFSPTLILGQKQHFVSFGLSFMN
ncbi:MAG: hypothetical protein JO199_00555 [Candidatus Eremiobacteraeota bacterium]|nr:hypothetical protein [Candidatus Eremiobacteraeota bacterium]